MKNKLHLIVLQKGKQALLFAAMFLFTFSTVIAQSNLITNGGFENGTIDWSVWGATLSTTTDAHTGSSAAKVSNRKNPWDAVVTDITTLLVSGQPYTLSAWIKTTGPAANLRATIALNVGGNTTYNGYLQTASPVVGSYAFYTGTFTLTWTGNLISANLYFETESVGGLYSDYLVDDVQLVKYVPVQDIVQKGPGWKDIKSTMLIGGCATEGDKNYFTNAAAKAQVLKDCNTLTVQCYPCWGRWDELKHHVYHVDDFTNKVQELKKQYMTVTAHMLLGWDQYFPDWFKKNDFPADTLDAIMKSWLKGIIQYKGNDTLVDVWNVVNEAISWDGKGGYWPLYNSNFNDACEFERMGFEPDASGLTGTMHVNTEHPVYIRKAFEYARTLTKKKLELRDSGFEFPADGAKYNAFYQLAVHLKKMNAPVDVIGFQTHLDLEKIYDWEAYTNNIKRYVQLGYQVNIPEVDIGDATKSWSDYKADLQKLQYYKLVTAAIKGGANELQTWGFIDDGWRVGQKAFPYSNNFEPKPAYYGIQEALTDMSSILNWEMDTPSNNLMPDMMKYNNFGTLNNFTSPVIVSGFKSKALQFDGIDDYISTGKLSENISGNLTFSCFIKTATNKAGIIADIAKDGISGLKIGINHEGKIYLNAADAGLNADLVGTTAVNDNAWHFIAIQRDSVTYRLYIDDSTPAASGNGIIQNYNQLTVGAKSDGSNAFEGAVDEVKLYASAIEEGSFVRAFAPFPPMKLAIQSNVLRIKLTWLDQSTNETGFVVERKTKEGNWEERGRVAANVVSFLDVLDQYSTEYTYRIRSFTSIGSSAASDTISYITPQDPNTGITESSAILSLSVYPNPVRDKFTMVTLQSTRLKILDIHGKLMLMKDNLSGTENIDISSFSSGIYFLQTCNSNKTNVVKIIKL
jgi:GH35 family endo-1,4-beta-xylanase